MAGKTVIYEGPGGPFEGYAAWDDGVAGPRPGVLVIPNILGRKAADDAVADRLAVMGYAALSCDLFGRGKRTRRGDPDMSRYMDELNADRALLRARLEASLAALAALEAVDLRRMAAIGFCFGGKAALDCARFGAPVQGVVSFHGVYDRPDYPTIVPIRAKVLVCHGWDDPLGPPQAVVALADELTEARADWRLDAHGGAGHAFTDREVADEGDGFGFNEAAARRSWRAMETLFGEAWNGRAASASDQ